MRRVALATSRYALPGAAPALESHLDTDSPLLITALAALGVEAVLEVWDDESVDWESYDLVVVRSTWGYARSYARFLEWARSRERLVNPYEVIAYCTDKHYLGDLARRGVAVVDTAFCEVGETPDFPDGDFVVKPAVGAGSIDAARYAQQERASALEHVARLHSSGRCALIQPYVFSIDEDGERALVFIDGEFSHAVTKAAHLAIAPEERDGDFRTRQLSRAAADPEAVAFAREVLSGPFADLAYGRVDVVATRAGWQLMELELAEPALYLAFFPAGTTRLAHAITRRVAPAVS